MSTPVPPSPFSKYGSGIVRSDKACNSPRDRMLSEVSTMGPEAFHKQQQSSLELLNSENAQANAPTQRRRRDQLKGKCNRLTDVEIRDITRGTPPTKRRRARDEERGERGRRGRSRSRSRQRDRKGRRSRSRQRKESHEADRITQKPSSKGKFLVYSNDLHAPLEVDTPSETPEQPTAVHDAPCESEEQRTNRLASLRRAWEELKTSEISYRECLLALEKNIMGPLQRMIQDHEKVPRDGDGQFTLTMLQKLAVKTDDGKWVVPQADRLDTPWSSGFTWNDYASIFPQAEMTCIMSASKMLCETFCSNIKEGVEVNAATIVATLKQIMRLAKPYVTSKEKFTQAFWDMKKKKGKKFEEFIRKQASKHNGESFEGMMITPVQRLMRYLILLKAIQKYTLKTDQNYPHLQEGIKECEIITLDINDAKDKMSVSGRVFELMKSGRIPSSVLAKALSDDSVGWSSKSYKESQISGASGTLKRTPQHKLLVLHVSKLTGVESSIASKLRLQMTLVRKNGDSPKFMSTNTAAESYGELPKPSEKERGWNMDEVVFALDESDCSLRVSLWDQTGDDHLGRVTLSLEELMNAGPVHKGYCLDELRDDASQEISIWLESVFVDSSIFHHIKRGVDGKAVDSAMADSESSAPSREAGRRGRFTSQVSSRVSRARSRSRSRTGKGDRRRRRRSILSSATLNFDSPSRHDRTESESSERSEKDGNATPKKDFVLGIKTDSVQRLINNVPSNITPRLERKHMGFGTIRSFTPKKNLPTHHTMEDKSSSVAEEVPEKTVNKGSKRKRPLSTEIQPIVAAGVSFTSNQTTDFTGVPTRKRSAPSIKETNRSKEGKGMGERQTSAETTSPIASRFVSHPQKSRPSKRRAHQHATLRLSNKRGNDQGEAKKRSVIIPSWDSKDFIQCGGGSEELAEEGTESSSHGSFIAGGAKLPSEFSEELNFVLKSGQSGSAILPGKKRDDTIRRPSAGYGSAIERPSSRIKTDTISRDVSHAKEDPKPKRIDVSAEKEGETTSRYSHITSEIYQYASSPRGDRVSASAPSVVVGEKASAPPSNGATGTVTATRRRRKKRKSTIGTMGTTVQDLMCSPSSPILSPRMNRRITRSMTRKDDKSRMKHGHAASSPAAPTMSTPLPTTTTTTDVPTSPFWNVEESEDVCSRS